MRLALVRRRTRVALVLLLVTLAGASGCVMRVWTPKPSNVPFSAGDVAEPRQVRSPLKAHLTDGTTVVFRDGASIGHGLIVGHGVSATMREKKYERVHSATSVVRWRTPRSWRR